MMAQNSPKMGAGNTLSDINGCKTNNNIPPSGICLEYASGTAQLAQYRGAAMRAVGQQRTRATHAPLDARFSII